MQRADIESAYSTLPYIVGEFGYDMIGAAFFVSLILLLDPNGSPVFIRIMVMLLGGYALMQSVGWRINDERVHLSIWQGTILIALGAGILDLVSVFSSIYIHSSVFTGLTLPSITSALFATSVAEELAFDGFGYRWLLRGFTKFLHIEPSMLSVNSFGANLVGVVPIALAVLSKGVLFGYTHKYVYGYSDALIFYTVIAGILLAIFYELTHNLSISIGIHMSINLLPAVYQIINGLPVT